MTTPDDREPRAESQEADRDAQGENHRRESDGFPARAMAATSRVVAEGGRWVVYLSVDFWEPPRCDEQTDTIAVDASEGPIRTVWKRISDYADRSRAEVAASWMERSADRHLHRPPSGF